MPRFAYHWAMIGVLAFVILPWLVYELVRGFRSLRVKLAGGPEAHAIKLIRKFVAAHADWKVRVYRTPAGLRALALHRRFTPNDPEAQAFFRAIGSDPIYVRMCVNQQCFRARVSPKPWRIGQPHIRPSPGTWPINPERLPERREWITRYEQAARAYASCHFVEAMGSGSTDDSVRQVQELHDMLSRANDSLPLA